jgi:transposase InsO family protein
MAHANARLNLNGRLLLVDRVRRQGWAVAHAAKAMGISRQCAHRWVKRYDQHGAEGLVDRSSRPRRMPTRTPATVEEQIIELRLARRRGADWIGPELGVPVRTVGRVLARHQMPRLALLDPLTGELIRSSKQTAVRYEKDYPGELVHMDVKKVGKIPAGGGWKAHGRAMGKTSEQKKARIGYDYLHSMVDDHSRFAYTEILPDEKGETCALFLARASAAFAAAGIARIERVMTDNHWSYTRSNDMKKVLKDLGAKHKLIRPHCPWQNGKVERFNRTLAIEWAYAMAYLSNTQRAAALEPWLQHYNTERRHWALEGRTPISRVSPT